VNQTFDVDPSRSIWNVFGHCGGGLSRRGYFPTPEEKQAEQRKLAAEQELLAAQQQHRASTRGEYPPSTALTMPVTGPGIGCGAGVHLAACGAGNHDTSDTRPIRKATLLRKNRIDLSDSPRRKAICDINNISLCLNRSALPEAGLDQIVARAAYGATYM
jgi:hypothetical protein